MARLSDGLERAPRQHLIDLFLGMFESRCLLTAVELGIADLLAGGPQHVDELAQRTETQPDPLFRVLRALESVGVFAQVAPRTFANSAASAALRRDAEGSMWAGLRFFAPGWGQYEVWNGLTDTLRSGRNAFEATHGFDVWEYYRRHPDQAEVFNEGMRAWWAEVGPAIARAYDWSRHEVIADVGGGIGSQLVDILNAHPRCRGLLFDQPAVVQQHIAHPRLEAVGGDFFAAVPSGADAYLLRAVIHDWDDARSVVILRNVRRAIGDDASPLMLVEDVIPETQEWTLGKWGDLHMMLVAGNGRERTAAEYRALLDEAGFRLTEIVPTPTPHSIVVAAPK